ncbi:HAD family hydrolase [Frondihabitans cladoniiphilus]|uniref:HAD family hydrolase n=1 Tax=Frondihabitans cladoniiphilus TaxID=715785 RepID=A0ABP8W944_9MICO
MTDSEAADRTADDARGLGPLPAAVLWDMDGTLVDTEPYWQQSQIELVAEFGGTWSREDGDSLIGSGLWHSAKVLQDHGVDLPPAEIIDRMTADVMKHIKGDMPWRPGAHDLLQQLKEAGVPVALVTMSFRKMAEFIVDAIDLPGFSGPVFDAIVSGDEVEHAKPHPEPYLTGADLLGVPIERCIAIEDSPTGLASAVASGAVAVGVEHHAPLDGEGGYQQRDTLAGVTLDDLRGILRTGSSLATAATGDSE